MMWLNALIVAVAAAEGVAAIVLPVLAGMRLHSDSADHGRAFAAMAGMLKNRKRLFAAGRCAYCLKRNGSR